MKKIISKKILIIFTITLLTAVSAVAQHGGRIEKEIKFPAGQNSVTLKGSIPSILVGHDYKITVRSGQKLSVKLTTAKNGVSFVINKPDGDTMDGAASVNTWSGEISTAGEYHIIVGSAAKGAKPYTLQFELR
jgi:hypothetical protein